MNTTPTCEGCGECCAHMSSPPVLFTEFEALPDTLAHGIREYLAGLNYRDDGPCIWLDQTTKKCKHYEHRPGVCRDFNLGSESCHRHRANVGLTVEGWPAPTGDDD